MDEDKFKRMISAIGLTIMTGDIHIRIQYIGIMISHLEHWIETEKIAKDRDAILSVKQNLINTFNFMVASKVRDLNMKDEQVRAFREYFRNHAIILDRSWGDPRAYHGAQALAEMEGLRLARRIYLDGVEAYSDACKGRSEGLTQATVQCDHCIKIIFDICYSNNLMDISEKEFMKMAASHPAPSQPEPVRGKT